jgi:hypothetical protein
VQELKNHLKLLIGSFYENIPNILETSWEMDKRLKQSCICLFETSQRFKIIFMALKTILNLEFRAVFEISVISSSLNNYLK